jgi:phasin family protein
MYVTPEQIQTANKSNVEALLALANAQFSAIEKLANISAGAVKSAFEDSIANTRALLGAKDVQEFVTLQNSFAQPAIEKAIAYSKSVRSRDRSERRAEQGGRAPRRRVERELREHARQGVEERPGRLRRRGGRDQVDARRRQLGL